MKQFFKMLFASFLGAGLAFFLVISIVIGGLAGLSALGQRHQAGAGVGDTAVLELKLEGSFVEKEQDYNFNIPMGFKFGDIGRTVGLFDTIHAIKKAQKDNRIKGLYIRTYGIEGGWASFEALARAVEKFRASGKWVVVYGEALSEKELLIAHAASEIYLYPYGNVEFDGISTTPFYVKPLLDKLEIKADIFKVGDFKSATEPFTRDSMSEEDRLQTQTIINDLWSVFAARVAKSTKITIDALDQVAASLAVVTARDAAAQKLVTALKNEEEVFNLLRVKTKVEKEKDIPFVDIREYLRSISPGALPGTSVAVLVLEGEIIDGESEEGQIGSESVVEDLIDIEEDKTIKAVVLRVNSPGGSALASDVIWQQIEKLKKKKPVFASYGDVSASGGYYLSAGAQKIFAEASTITGSIGVFGLRFYTKEFFDAKIGIKFDRVVTHEYADVGNSNRLLSDYERSRIQLGVDETYGRFLEVVTKGRKMERAQLEPLASGRVWSGIKAKENKLIDGHGGLHEVIDVAAKFTKIKDHGIVFYPVQRNPIEQLLEDLSGGARLLARDLLGGQAGGLEEAQPALKALPTPLRVFAAEVMKSLKSETKKPVKVMARMPVQYLGL